MTLRDYQETAVRMVDDYYSQPQSQSGRLCLVLPTGAGKSVIAAALVSRTEGRSILLTHQKELLEDYDIFALEGSYETGNYSETLLKKRAPREKNP